MQGKKLLLIAISGLTTLTLTMPAFATMSVPDGWYIEGNVGSTRLSNKSFSPASASSSGVGGNLNIGYKFMPYLGAEIGYTRYANTSIKYLGTKVASVKYYSYDIAAKGILPITNTGFEPFAKLGVERLNAHASVTNGAAANNISLSSSQHSSTGLYFGLGVQYYFMPEFAAVAQWQRASGSSSTGTMDLFSLGLSFLVD